MVQYRRNFVPGGTFFFTVTLADRRSSALVENIDVLREAFRVAQGERPFSFDAVVVLPEHLHAIMTLPSTVRIFLDDGGASRVGSRGTSSEAVRKLRATAAANTSCGNDASGSTPSGTIAISRGTLTTSTIIR
jgi:hypothetical protein